MRPEFEEAFNLLCGERIGRGMSRDVFECSLLPDCVVKVETDAQRFQNILEWQTWEMVKHTAASRWFAECRWLSPNGRVLIQERTRPAGPGDYPKRVPVWFTDLKRGNWGMAVTNDPQKQYLVCHDYGTSLVIQEGTTTKRLRVANWSEDR